MIKEFETEILQYKCPTCKICKVGKIIDNGWETKGEGFTNYCPICGQKLNGKNLKSENMKKKDYLILIVQKLTLYILHLLKKENGLLLLRNGATINTINMAHNMVYFVAAL